MVRLVFWRHWETPRIIHGWTQRYLNTSIIKVHPEVESSKKPVVALESTIFAHGMPFPHNLQLARDIISIIQSKGVIPAIIAVKNGICRVGLTEEELVDLTKAGMEGRAHKCSTRELPLILAKTHMATTSSSKESTTIWGATTVASTMKLAHLAGIQTFVTGGTGGVHRDGQNSMDISADLQELAKTPVVVVSAGIKSILDIPRTLEVLETLGVPTVTYQSDEFPAFFSPSSGVKAPARVDSVQEIARAYRASLDLGLNCGLLVAVPNQDPAGERTEHAIQEAIADAAQLGIQGRDVTPYILQAVASKTDGDSLRSNIALVKRNASIGADIALALFHPNGPCLEDHSRANKIVVMGGSVVDIIAKPDENSTLILGTSTPGTCHESDGGVGRNIAEVLGRLDVKPILYSAVGEDARGKALLDSLRRCGVSCEPGHSVAVMKGVSTSTYLAILDAQGDLHSAIADMKVLHHIPVPCESVLNQARFLVIDANPPIEKMLEAAMRAVRLGVSVFFEPTSEPKANKAFKCNEFVSCLTYASPNAKELIAMANADDKDVMYKNEGQSGSLIILRDAATRVLKRMMPEAYLIITLGENGVLFATKSKDDIQCFHFPAEQVNVKNTTGGGDSLAGAYLKAVLDGKSHREAIEYGQIVAVQSIAYEKAAISPYIRLKS